MPSATGQDWEKYKKFADDEIEEKKITPLTDEYVVSVKMLRLISNFLKQKGHSSPEDVWRSSLCGSS